MNNSRRRKRKYNSRFIILCVAILAVTAILGYLVFEDVLHVGFINPYLDGLDRNTVRENVKEKYADSFEAKDYTVYGEELSFYSGKYGPKTFRSMQGMMVLLRNIETQEEITYTLSAGIDVGVSLHSLRTGVYEIYVYDHFIEKRLYFEKEINSDTFTSVARAGLINEVTLQASSDFLSDFGIKSDKNYAYLTVKNTKQPEDVYDVIIDPSGFETNEWTGVDPGYEDEKISEGKASYELALMIQEKLEAAGLKVKLTRGEDEAINYYGDVSRVSRGYTARGKVFLSLTLYLDAQNLYRPMIQVSPYSDGMLANRIAKTMTANGLEMAYITNAEDLERGVLYASFIKNDKEKNTRFDAYPPIREAGGKATFAGQYEGYEENAKWSDFYGMYSILFEYANIANPDSIDYYLANKEAIADSIVEAILDYYEIEVVTGETNTK